MSVAPERADLFEEAAHRNGRIPEGVSQWIEPPAFAAMEKFFKSLDGELWMRHKSTHPLIH
jgi:hypothetical protein